MKEFTPSDLMPSDWHMTSVKPKNAEPIDFFGNAIPASYNAFANWSWKGEGQVKNVYFAFWAPNDVLRLNAEYQIQKYLGKKIVAIGTDGGSIAFLLDFRLGGIPRFASINLGDLDPGEVKILAENFENAIQAMVDGKIDGNEL